MKLKIQTSSAGFLSPDQSISLVNNGANIVRIIDSEEFNVIIEVESPVITFHTDDEVTEIQLNGFIWEQGRYRKFSAIFN